MFSSFRKLMSRGAASRAPAIPAGERVYAVGDIHGRLDLFERLVGEVEHDDARRGQARTTVILLGDLIDRGPDSASVLRLAREWGRHRHVEYIQGNHEEMLLISRTDPDALRSFLKFGGLETFASYGIDPALAQACPAGELQGLIHRAIPPEHFDFIDSFRISHRIGDYLFVHAGVRPDVPLDRQLGRDCRWIREPFLSHRGDFGAVVVHGHTITPEPDVRDNRIGIDTGAYRHGTLTAIGLEGEERWFLTARGEAGSTTAY